MNRKLGLLSAAAVTVLVVLFALLMLVRLDYGAYGASLLISWAYLVLACSFAVMAGEGEQVAAQAGIAFAVLYAGFVTSVYFVQLTTILHQSAPVDILNALNYQTLGSLMFNLDLLGYALMSISTLFTGLTVTRAGRANKWLRYLLICHGVFAPICIALPIIDVFGTMPKQGGDAVGTAVLLLWCAYFLPVGILAVFHFSAPQAFPQRRQLPSTLADAA
ncbi:hypothetical protein [Devosia sp.]|uniref:hypothetical protein n=1 Tax=Devosia sp. TaxID=1871048 RepID=UPI0032646339